MNLKMMELFEKRSKVTVSIRSTFKKLYPIGSTLQYSHGKHLVVAEVIGYDYGERVKVRSVKTGKEYWIDYYRVQ